MNKIQAKAALRTAERALKVDPTNPQLLLAVESAKAILEKLEANDVEETGEVDTSGADKGSGEGDTGGEDLGGKAEGSEKSTPAKTPAPVKTEAKAATTTTVKKK